MPFQVEIPAPELYLHQRSVPGFLDGTSPLEIHQTPKIGEIVFSQRLEKQFIHEQAVMDDESVHGHLQYV